MGMFVSGSDRLNLGRGLGVHFISGGITAIQSCSGHESIRSWSDTVMPSGTCLTTTGDLTQFNIPHSPSLFLSLCHSFLPKLEERLRPLTGEARRDSRDDASLARARRPSHRSARASTFGRILAF